MNVATMFWKSRKNTFIALNRSASAVPNTAMMAKPRSLAAKAAQLGCQPRDTDATNRISSCGNELIAETIIADTGNISRGIAILRRIALLRTIARVPDEKVSVK